MAEYRPLSASTSLLRRGRSQAEQGMLAPTLGAVLLLLFGSAALVAGSLNWQTTSSRGGDAEQAREAAEWGFNTLVDRLNEPGNSHLLVSKWSTASTPPNWLDNAGVLTSCGVTTDIRGAVDRSQLITGTQTVAGRQVRYRLTNFEPPAYPSNTAPVSLPQPCKDNFANLAGGTVRFTVVGEVLQNGNVIASHRIVRDATVEALADASSDSSQAPDFGGVGGGALVAPVLTFLATGGAPGLVALSSADSMSKRPEFLYDKNDNLRKGGGDLKVERIFCLLSCDNNGDLQKLANANLSSSYTLEAISPNLFKDSSAGKFPTKPPVAGGFATSQVLNIQNGNTTDANRCFPFTRSANNNTSACTQNLMQSCSNVSLPTQSGPLEPVIACRIRFNEWSKSDSLFTVNNHLTTKPVVLYLIGASHKIKANATIVNQRFVNTRSVDPSSWSTLRIYGDPATAYQLPIQSGMTLASAQQCNNNSKQQIEFGGNVSVEGAFLWIPKGEIVFKDYSSNSGFAFYGAIWTCNSAFGENFAILNSASPDEVRRGIDKALGLVGSAIPARYAVRGVERSQWGEEQES